MLLIFIKLSKDIIVELHGLPEPSAYARHITWRVWQKKETAILNLRPPTNEGLPIEVLHPAFATFVHDTKSIPPDEWALEDDVNQVSLALCRVMACDFDSERARCAELMKQLHPLGLGLRMEFHIEQTPPLETHSAWPGLCIADQDTIVLLGEVKSEFERLTGCALAEGYGLSETSPRSPCGMSCVGSSRDRISTIVPGIGSPIEPALFTPLIGLAQTTGEVSLKP